MRRIITGLSAVLSLVIAGGLGAVWSGARTDGAALMSIAQASEQQASSDAGRRCSESTLHGRFGFVAQGTVLPPLTPAPAPVANSGRITFDGHGAFRGFDVVSLGGQIVQRTFEGTYDVRGDCVATGRLRVLTGTPGLVINFQAVIVDDGDEVFFIETDPSTIYTGTLNKI